MRHTAHVGEKRDLKESTAWKLSIDERITLTLFLTGYVWFMIGTSDSLLCLWEWTFVFS